MRRSAACSPSPASTTSQNSVLQVLQINRLHYHQLWYTNATPSHPTSSTLTCAAKSPRANLPKRRGILRCICDEHSKDLPENLNCLSTNSERNLSQCANSSSIRSDTSQSTKSSSKVTSPSQPLGASRKATMLPRTLPSDDWMNEWNDDTPSSSNSHHDNVVDGNNLHMPRPVPKQYSSIEDVDLEHELANQLAEAMAHRDWIVANSENTDPKNVTDSIKTCNTLISQIISKQQTVVNMKRMLAVENAVIETMKEFPQAVKDKFFEILEQNLKGQS